MEFKSGDETFLKTNNQVPYTVSGERLLGGYRLLFRFYCNDIPGNSRAQILDGRLELSGENHVPPVGCAWPVREEGKRWGSDGFMLFSLDLDLRRLEGITRLRQSGVNLRLRADIALLIQGQQGLRWVSDSETLQIPPAMWLHALSECGYGDTLIAEMVLKRDDADPELASAISALRDALKSYRDSSGNDANSRAAVFSARLAFDAGDLDARRLPILPRRSVTDQLSKTERIQVLRWAIKLVAHLSAHDPTVQWAKRDAWLVCFSAAALIEWETRPE